ncbi:MAG: hypothetical protein PWQ37_176 [Candidatus Petromonas sp.]|jgi:predicted Zn-dependent peptidase|nr:hypothetical protein [Candidatus Petromonas sp.]
MHKKYILNNGIRVVTKKISHVRSVSIGFWINTGSASETPYNNGISHFIEHMLFKGTYNRTAKEIASTLDGIGGQLNAFTSKECTCYYSKVLDSHINIAIDVLSDMLLNSKLDNKDIIKEKSVVYEEINMYEDSPEDVTYDLLSKTIFDKHPLGLPILGTYDTVNSLDRNTLTNYIEKNYNNENIVVSVAGSFDPESLIETLNKKIGSYEFKSHQKTNYDKPFFNNNFSYKTKDIEQIHLCIGYEGVPNNEHYLYPLLVMNNIFGGSMSSRLFQTIREDNGLAYSIYSHPSFYKDFGLFTIYVSLNPSQLDSMFYLIFKEIENLVHNSITPDEFEKSKEQLKGNYILGLESTSSIMTMLGKSELFGKKIKTPEEIISQINDVKISDVKNIIDLIFNTDKVSMASVGRLKENSLEKNYRLLKALMK